MKNTNNKDKFSSVITVVCILAVVVISCCAYMTVGHFKPEVKESVESYLETLGQETTTEPEQTESYTARLMCVGDNIIHSAIYNQASERSDGDGYDFSYVYREVKSILEKSDISMINQETVISAELAPSTYPAFCSPTAVGDAICDLGFDVVNHANKNIGDKGSEGAQDTIDYWKTKSDVTLIGLYQSSNMIETIPVKEVNGIRFSFIGITENVNKALPSDALPYVICLNEEGKTTADVYNQVKSLIKKAETISDVVVVSMHFDGNEENTPTTTQQDIVNYLVTFGADVVIGSGTYSVQPIDVREKTDGSQAVIAYSLGNFVSAQTAKENMLGAIADIVFTKDAESGEVTVEKAKLIPVVTMYESNYTNVRVVPLSSLDAETADTHGIYGLNLEYIETYFAENVGEDYLEINVLDTQALMDSVDETADEETTDDESTTEEVTQ